MINKIDLMNPSGLILVGRTGENAFRTITFDASTWGADFPDATYTVVYKRSDGYIYPVLVNAAADAIVWSPTDTDTAVSGNGQIEVRLLDGETIGKTIVMQTFVAPSLSGDESEPSRPAPDWVNDVAEDADRAEAAVSHYPEIRDGFWWTWDSTTETWVNTGDEARGEKGDTGDSFVDATYDSNTGTLTLIPGNPDARGYVTPEWFGAKGDGVTDDTAAIQAAVDSGCNVSFRQGKTYKCGTINVTKDIEIDCRWAEFICTGETLFNCTGRVTESVAGSDYVANAPYTLLNNDKYTGFALLRSVDNVITMRDYYYGGFVTLFTEGVCNDCRPVGFTGVTVDKITPIICRIKNVGNVVFDAVRDKNTVVKCTYGLNCEFGGFDIDGDYYSTVSLKKCYRCKVHRANGYLTYTGALPNYYAIGFDDSSECVAEDCDLTSDFWHCYDVGSNYLCFDNVARNCSFFAGRGAVAYNNHANGIGSIIENCVINNVSIGAGGVVKNTRIVEHATNGDGTGIQCRIAMHPTNVAGINTLTVDNVIFDYENASSSGDRGVFIRCSAYTTGNHFILDSLNVSHISTAHDADLVDYPDIRIIPTTTLGDFTLAGDIVLDDVVGCFFLHQTADYPNIIFSGNRKALIRNMRRVRTDGQGLFRLGTSSDHRFPPIVEIRDSVVWQITGQFEKLLMFNVSSTHYIIGGFNVSTLIGDNVSRLNTNDALIARFTNARVTNMRFSDTSLWTYLYISNGSGCYGLLGANGIENRVLS